MTRWQGDKARRTRGILIAAGLLLAVLPGVACAGDSPIWVTGDWGVGEIDGRIMLYLGKGRYLDTPLPAPPRGPRWAIVYDTLPWLAAGACAIGLARLLRGGAAIFGRCSRK